MDSLEVPWSSVNGPRKNIKRLSAFGILLAAYMPCPFSTTPTAFLVALGLSVACAMKDPSYSVLCTWSSQGNLTLTGLHSIAARYLFIILHFLEFRCCVLGASQTKLGQHGGIRFILILLSGDTALLYYSPYSSSNSVSFYISLSIFHRKERPNFYFS